MTLSLMVYVVNFHKSFKSQFFEAFLPFTQNYLFSFIYSYQVYMLLFYAPIYSIFPSMQQGKKLYVVHFDLHHSNSLSLM